MIGFIGVGVMGEPICRHVASKSGHAVYAYDIAAEPLERLSAHGVKRAASVREIAGRAGGKGSLRRPPRSPAAG